MTLPVLASLELAHARQIKPPAFEIDAAVARGIHCVQQRAAFTRTPNGVVVSDEARSSRTGAENMLPRCNSSCRSPRHRANKIKTVVP